MASLPLLSAVVGFLCAGYPEGIPVKDYIPLFALLARRLSNEEVIEVADALIARGDPATAAALRRAISDFTQQPTLDADIARASAHMAAGGWPLAFPHDEGPPAFPA